MILDIILVLGHMCVVCAIKDLSQKACYRCISNHLVYNNMYCIFNYLFVFFYVLQIEKNKVAQLLLLFYLILKNTESIKTWNNFSWNIMGLLVVKKQ